MNKGILLAGVSTFAFLMSASTPAFADGASADASATVSGNTAIDDGSLRDNLIDNSYNGGAAGVAHVQQNEGNNNAINAATSVHADVTGGTSMISAATAGSTSENNLSSHTGGDHKTDRDNEILDTMVKFHGTGTLQQNNGDNNAINAATALDGIDGGVLEIEQSATAVGLVSGQFGPVEAKDDKGKNEAKDGKDDKTGDLLDDESNRNNLIDPSFNDARGVITVQQNNGNGNAMSAATAVGGVAGDSGSLKQDVTADGSVSDSKTKGQSSRRNNEILDSFERFEGVATVQQNNGDANSMNAATAVIFSSGEADGDMKQNVELKKSTVRGVETKTEKAKDGKAPSRGNYIDPSFTDVKGVITVQQNNGDANSINVGNGVAIALGGVTGKLEQKVKLEENALGGDDKGKGKDDKGGKGKDDKGGDVKAEDKDLDSDNEILSSFNNAKGVITVQQNNGDANTINAGTAVAFSGGDVGGDAKQEVNAKKNDINSKTELNSENSTRHNLIDPSFTGAMGVITVQQNNGNANSMNAGTGVLGVTGNVGGKLEQKPKAEDNNIEDVKTEDKGKTRDNRILNSFESAAGVISVQQNNGDANSVNTAIAVAGVLGNVEGGVKQDAHAKKNQLKKDVDVGKSESDRINLIDPSFTDAHGVITVQQNNGDANTLNVAVAVLGIGGNVNATEDKKGKVGTFLQEVEAEENSVETKKKVENAKGTRSNEILDSFVNAHGVITVQQNNGDANSINAATAVAGVGGDISIDVEQEIRVKKNDIGETELKKAKTSPENLIDPSFTNAVGVITVQQNNGQANSMNVGNGVLAIAGNVVGHYEQNVLVTDNDVDLKKKADKPQDKKTTRTNHIIDSFEGAEGVITVQQNNGDGNTINAGTGVAVLIGDAATISQTADATGHDVNGDDEIKNEKQNTRTNLIDPSFTDAKGVITVQQNNGTANSMNVANAAALTIGSSGALDQTAMTEGEVDNTVKGDEEEVRTNTVTDSSFTNTEGVITVQQNNGDSNVVSAANAVMANIGDGQLGDVAQTASAIGTVDRADAEAVDKSGTRENLLDGSVFESAQGVITVQQNNGSNNVMGATNAVRIQIGSGASDGALEDVTSQVISAEGMVLRSNATEEGDTKSKAADRDNLLTDSFKGGVNGVITVQQNNGDNNSISASTGVAADVSGVEDIESVSSSTASTAGTVDDNTATDTSSNRLNTIDGGEADGLAGVATVQQNNGNNNTMNAATGVSANIGTGNSVHGSVSADASGTANVTDNTATVTEDVDRLNTIDSSFDSVQGIFTVQQNEGDNNSIGAATSFIASTELPGFGPAASTSTLGATVSGNSSTLVGDPGGPTLTNAVTGSFASASGIFTIQQNNGNNNGMGSAISGAVSGISFGFND